MADDKKVKLTALRPVPGEMTGGEAGTRTEVGAEFEVTEAQAAEILKVKPAVAKKA